MKVYIASADRVSPNSTHRPYRSQFSEYDFVCLEPCSLTDPVFIVSGNVPVMSASIAYIPDLGNRFYTITSKVRRAGGMWEVHMHSHPLMSMMRYFVLNSTTNVAPVRVNRTPVPITAPTDWGDSVYVVDDKRYLKRWQITRRANSGDCLMVNRDGAIIAGWDDTGARPRQLFAWGAGYDTNERCFAMGFTDAAVGYRVIVGTMSDLYAIIADLCSTSLSGVSDQALAKFYGDPLSNVKFIRVLPCFMTAIRELVDRGIANNITGFNIGYYPINRSVVNIHVNNPMSTVIYGFGYNPPKHPAYDSNAYGRSYNLNRSPYNNLWFNLPPYGKVPIDTTRLVEFADSRYFTIGVWNEIDLVTGEGRLYLSYKPEGGGDDWMSYAPKDLVATCPVCQEVPIMAIVQNVSAIRASELGLAKLDTQKYLPQNIILQNVGNLLTGVADTVDQFLNTGVGKQISSTVDSAADYMSDAVDSVMRYSIGTNPFSGTKEASAPIKGVNYSLPHATAQAAPSFSEQVTQTAKKMTQAMSSAYSFKLETAQYQTQLSDARSYPQTNVAGNAGGSLWFQEQKLTFVVGVYQEYWDVSDKGASVGYGVCMDSTIAACTTAFDTTPTWEILPMSEQIYSREGAPLLPSEMTELYQALTNGCALQFINDGW